MKEHNLTRLVGNAAHILTLISTGMFAVTAGNLMHDPTSTFFDEVWQKDGFCVTNRDVPYLNSHDMCLYVDTVLAVLCGLLYMKWQKDPGMEDANLIFKLGIPGIVFHGFGHGAIAKGMRDGVVVENGQALGIELLNEMQPHQLSQLVLLGISFWYALSKASMPAVNNTVVVFLATGAALRQLYVPQEFGFTYVQTVLLFQFSINQLARPSTEKNFAYCLYPILVGLPLTFVGWMESTMCSSFVKDYLYGHLVYDAYIPISMMAWYIIVHSRGQRSVKKVKSQ
jgi:hypothetical protein